MKPPKRQIIAIGGGAFSTDPQNPSLDRYLLAQARTPNPSVCFLPTATGDADLYIANFYTAYTKLRCRPTHVRLFDRTPDLEHVLLAQDVIFVGGGNTKSMLAVWREWQIPELLRKAWRSGTVLAGVSAGAICWFDVGITDSWANRLTTLPCLGMLPGTCCPHYDGEPERRPALHRLVTEGAAPSALAIEDGAAAHFVGRSLAQIVSARSAGGAYHVRQAGGRVVEAPLPVTRL